MLLRAILPATIDIRPYIETTAGTVLADPTQIHRGRRGGLEIRFKRVEVTALSCQTADEAGPESSNSVSAR
jgi:hypothetical protein